MAFAKTFPLSIHGGVASIALPINIVQAAGTATTDDNLQFIDLSGLGTFSRVMIYPEYISNGAASAFSIFMKGATKNGDPWNWQLPLITGLTAPGPLSSELNSLFYQSHNAVVELSTGSIGGSVKQLLNSKYIAIGIDVTGADDIIFAYSAAWEMK